MKLGASINEMSLVGAVTGHGETSRRFVDSSIVLQSYHISNISLNFHGQVERMQRTITETIQDTLGMRRRPRQEKPAYKHGYHRVFSL